MACGDVTQQTVYLPTCGLSAINILKRSEPLEGTLILPGDLLTWTFTIDSSAVGVGISFEDIFDNCDYVDMSSIVVSAGWTVTPDGGNPCRLVFDNPTAVSPGIFTCTLTATAGNLAGEGFGSIRNTANVLTPDPAAGNAVELTFGPKLEGAVPDQVVGVPMSYAYTIVSGTAPFTVALLVGILPTGLSISAAGVLSGTPTVSDDYNFTLQLTDGNGNTYDLSDECEVF